MTQDDTLHLYVVCPLHPMNVIVTYVARTTEPSFVWEDKGSLAVTEMVGPRNVSDNDLLAIGVTPAVAEPVAGDSPHLRTRFPCPRPSCAYEAEVRTDRINRSVDEHVERMIAEDARGRVVTGVDRPTWQVVIADTARP